MKRKIISIMTILAMCLTMGSVPTWAAETREMTNVTAPNQGNVTIGSVGMQSVSVFVPQTAKPLESQANTVHEVTTTSGAVTWTTGWYIVQGSTVEISQRINVDGDVHLILADGASLSASKGITVEGTNSLTIWGQAQGSGKLNAGTFSTTLMNAAGIGSRFSVKSGSITINGGQINSYGHTIAAGIGGGKEGGCGTIMINGGKVIAQSHTGGAGIGTGYKGIGGSVYINGGEVIANGGIVYGAGIGGGQNGRCDNINIKGGVIQATGGPESAGIEGVKSYESNKIDISGGKIEATGGSQAAGIGGGNSKASGLINISGGEITAKGGRYGAGIGGGNGGSGTIKIDGGFIEAIGGISADGIGNGNLGGGSSFSTGKKGNAVIFATAISDQSGKNANIWSGTIYENKAGAVYGAPTIMNDLTIPAEHTLTVVQGQTLTVADGVTVTNHGTLTNNGTICRATPATVTFQIENGTFGTGTDTVKTVQVPLVTAQGALTGTLQFAGTLNANDIPNNMAPADGYGKGQWNPTPNTTADAVTKNISYKYTCVALPKQATPNVQINYDDEILTGFSSSASYKVVVDGTTTEVINQAALPAADYIGKTISIVQKGDGITCVDSAPKTLTIPARPVAPTNLTATGPSFEDTEDGRINGLTKDTNYEYKRKNSNSAWQPLTEETKLATGIYEVRIKASTEAFTSSAVDVEVPTGQPRTYTINVTAPSFTAVQYGDAQPEAQPIIIASSGNSDTIIQAVTVSGEDFIIAGGGSTVLAGQSINSWTVLPKSQLDVGTHTATITVTTKDGKTVTAPVEIVVNKGNQEAPAVPIVKNKSAHGITLEAIASNGKGTEVEYSRDGGTTWQTNPTFTELEASTEYTIVARYQENAQYNASPASVAIKVRTEAVPSNPDKTETITQPDGSVTTVVTKPNQTVISTTKHPNGDVIKETKRPDGSGEIEMRQADGSQSTTTIDQAGQRKTTVQLSAESVAKAQQEKRCVEVPMPAQALNAQQPAQLRVALPAGTSAPVAVYLPVQAVNNTTVLMVRQADGSMAPVRKAINDDKGIKTVLTDALDCTIVDHAKTFIDTDGHWGEGDIDFVTSRDIFNGVGEQRFAPDAVTNRAMLVTVLHNLENHPRVDVGDIFEDVSDDAWYTEAVRWAAEKKLVSGLDATHFAPEASLSREQMATMLYRYAGSPKVAGDALAGYSDAAQVQPWAKAAMNWAVCNGVITGMGNQQLNPQGNATRAQLASIMHRIIALELQ